MMRVFKDLELVEYLGSGIPRIIEKYDKSVFHVSDNYVRVTFFYKKPFESDNNQDSFQTTTVVKTVEETVVKTVEEILQAIGNNPKITQNELRKITGLSVRGVEWNLAKLKEEGKIVRIGAKKGGYWQIVTQE